jgi:inositol-phosphate phosphatase / L-galactose 1-phosphate phosphatase / histidinol-phosphatase
MTNNLDTYVELANRLADVSGAIARRYFRTKVTIDDKADSSPVTIADREAETAMRELIAETFPTHGVIGEEHGSDRADASHVWVLDPIDGTKSFITGRPLFGALIALCREGRPVVGVIDCPALSERWIGAHGQPTLHQGKPVRTRPCDALDRAALYCTSPLMFKAPDFERFERVRKAVKLPMYGGDCFAYGLVASGFADLVIESGLNIYDYAALVPVLEGAGGAITDWQGRALGFNSDGRVVAAGDTRTHVEALAKLA